MYTCILYMYTSTYIYDIRARVGSHYPCSQRLRFRSASFLSWCSPASQPSPLSLPRIRFCWAPPRCSPPPTCRSHHILPPTRKIVLDFCAQPSTCWSHRSCFTHVFSVFTFFVFHWCLARVALVLHWCFPLVSLLSLRL